MNIPIYHLESSEHICLFLECSEHSCLNGGSCVEGHDQVTCVCPWGFSGRLCEVSGDSQVVYVR